MSAGLRLARESAPKVCTPDSCVVRYGSSCPKASDAEEDNRGARERLFCKGLLRPGKAGGSAILDERLPKLPVSVSEVMAADRNDRL